MKAIHWRLFILSVMLTLLLSPSCKKNSDVPSGFNAEAQKFYEGVISLQQQSQQVFDGYLATQDTAAAKVSLAAWFKSNAAVEWAKVSAQGVMVKYTNGICGGLLIDLQRTRSSGESLKSTRSEILPKTYPLKNLPSKKKAIILAAYFDQFMVECSAEANNWGPDFASEGFSCEFFLEGVVNLDLLSALTGYGVIDFNTHGVAWPDEVNTEEVYMMTRENASNVSTKKYWDDIQKGTLAIVKLKNVKSSIYAIKPQFITEHNDFTKDTVLFYGGFCYSALGSWPEIVNSCASGTYFGFNWSIDSWKCANWAISLVKNLSDHTLATPMTVEQWMSSTDIPKDYYYADLKKTVKIMYNGYGGLTLWKPDTNVKGGIFATAVDGAPILKPGYTCTDYVLKCRLNGKLSTTLGYEWEYGNGSATYYTINDSLSLRHSWASEKSYTVSVTVTDYSTNTVVKKFSTVVSFADPGYLPQLKSQKNLEVDFGPTGNIHLTSGTGMYVGYFYFTTPHYSTPLTWVDSSFSARNFIDNDHEIINMEGNVSADGRILKHALFSKTYTTNNILMYELNLEIANLPIIIKDTINCLASHVYNTYGSINQTYITRAEFKAYDNVSKSYITISGIDWPETYLNVLFRNDN